MAQDTSAFDAALKDVYIGPIREELNQKTNLLDFFTESDVTQYEWQGRRLVFALHSSRNYSGVKAVAESGGLPVAGQQGTTNLFIPIKSWEGRIQLTAQVMKASRSDKGAFTRAMDLEQKGLVNDLARQRNRALAGYGSGILATISAGAASATQSLKNPGGVAGTTNPSRFIKIGMLLAISDPTGVTIRGVQTVVSVTTSTVTFDASITTTTDDIVTIGTTSLGSNEDSFNDEPMGVLGIVDSTTYVTTIFGLNRSLAANAFFRSNILSSVGTISEDVLQRGTDNTEEVSGELIDHYVAHSSVRREMLKLTAADRRYNVAPGATPESFDAGSKVGQFKKDLPFNGTPVRLDKDFAYGTLVGVNKAHLQWTPETKGEWADDDGTVLFRRPNQDAYEARYRLFENFMSDKGNAHVRFDGITATVTSGVFAD